LIHIKAFYTTGKFNAGPTGKTSLFWGNTYHAIEMTKISAENSRGSSKSQARGSQLLDGLTMPALDNPLGLNTRTVLIELLSTLSPVNTTSCSYIRDTILGHLSEFAREQFPYNHPIKVVIEMLRHSSNEAEISLRALTFIIDRLREIIGPAHDLTILATDKLCTLLRQTGNYEKALKLGDEGVKAIRSSFGIDSMQERWLSRRIEHIYIDQHDWGSALGVCFDIVGQQHGSLDPDPLHRDACAIFTMEDIAKICEHAGNMEQALAWLKEAKLSGSMIWDKLEVLDHIDDKLQEVLTELGREDELEVWSRL
jgi:tetratricopeptide (TPR) repeat protein